MEGRFYDGRISRPWIVQARPEGDEIAIDGEGVSRRWSFGSLTAEPLGEMVRLSRGDDERLMITSAAWRALSGDGGKAAASRARSLELRLLAGLVLAGGGLAAFLFLGVPAASGPLARITPPAFEENMGESFDAQLGVAFKPCSGAAGQTALMAFGHRLQHGTATPFDIRVRAVQAPMINAFALPGGVVLVTDDLIAMTRTPDELSAVIAHEVAHVEKRHVMQAVWRSLGLGLILDAVVGGGSGAGQQAVLLAGSFADLRFTREAEAQADGRGMALLEAQGLSSQGMAPFFERLATKGQSDQAAAVKELISSHPDTHLRAAISRDRAKPGAPAFDPQAWAAIKATCATEQKPGFKLPWGGT